MPRDSMPRDSTRPTMTVQANNNGNNMSDDNVEPAVQVYLRVRPLIPEEENHDVVEYKVSPLRNQFKVKCVPSTSKQQQQQQEQRPTPINPMFAAAPPLRQRWQDEWKVFDGFTNIFEQQSNNESVYQATVQPIVSRIIAIQNHQSACVFTYGHTGSGKSHTLLGYDDKQELGIYKYAAKDLLQQIQYQESNDDDIDDDKKKDTKNNKKCLLVRITELYQENAIDLLTSEQCSIRDVGRGIVQVRGPMVVEDEEDGGRITQRPLGQLCSTYEQVVDCVDKACTSRRVGTSTHHDQSSRSHLVLELEVVTPELVKERNLLLTRNAQLTRLKWLQTERMFGKKHYLDHRPMPKWTQEYNDGTAPRSKLRKEIQSYETLVKESKQSVKKLEQDVGGGTLVFCDLAGNEYAADSKNSTKTELEESASINRSLLAIKAMIRSLHNNKNNQSNSNKNKQHVPYRDSKLTMMLRRHLDTKAIMLSHISPSQESIKKTINTLKYSSMVGQTTNSTIKKTSTSAAAPSEKKKKKGKENKPKESLSVQGLEGYDQSVNL